MLTDILLVLLGVVLTFGTAVFVTAEFSLVALDTASVRAKSEAEPGRYTNVVKALRSLSTQLSGAQVGITLTTILLGYTTQVALAEIFTRWVGDWGVPLALALTLGTIVSAVLVNAFSMLFGELIPKNLSLADPLHAARLVAPLQIGFTWLFKPLIRVLNGAANAILHSVGIEPREEISSARSASELSSMVRHSAEEGTLDEGTADLLVRSIMMRDLSAVDVMTDRGRMISITDEATATDLIELARSSGHSRFPVLGSNSDDVLGLVNLRRAIAVPFEKRDEVPVTAQSLMIEPTRVPETMPLAPLLVHLRDVGLQMAVVVDEYGGTAGIVTLEDVVEEIVGEVNDEHDSRRLGIRQVGKYEYLVPGTLRPDELLTRTDIKVPEGGPYETLGGLIMTELGRLAKPGDHVSVDGVRLEVKAIEGRRISRILVTGHPPIVEAEVSL